VYKLNSNQISVPLSHITYMVLLVGFIANKIKQCLTYSTADLSLLTAWHGAGDGSSVGHVI
jgi:hypothetical protein